LKNNYIFFRLHNEEISNQKRFEKVLEKYDIEIFVPTFLQLKKHQVRGYIYLFWFLFTKGKYRIIYVRKGGKIIHYTHVLPKFFKFPFMSSKDLEIGPSWTDDLYRGKGIFPAVIEYTVQNFKEKGRIFYAFAYIDNKSSQKAILKASFSKWMNGYKAGKQGIYRIENV
jgi:hypothetical protein